MAHVAASLSARPVLHHRFADTARAARDKERRRWRVETRGGTTRRGRRKERAVSESLRSSRETNLLASLCRPMALIY